MLIRNARVVTRDEEFNGVVLIEDGVIRDISRGTTSAKESQDWDGDYTDINGGNINDSLSINTNTTGDISTFTAPDFSATPAGSVIKAVVLGNRVRVVTGGAGPEHIQPVVTIGGIQYPAPAVPITAGFNGSIAIYEHDPSTSAPWASVANVNNPFGVKAVA